MRPNSKKKIIDCILFYDEIDLLKFRFTELYDFVDYFIVLESNRDFKNNDKDFNFETSQINFLNWSDKIIYIKLRREDYNIELNIKNQIKIYQNLLLDKIQKLNLDFDDIILFSEVDEIPPLFDSTEIEKFLLFQPIGFSQKHFVSTTKYINTDPHLGTYCFTFSQFLSNQSLIEILYFDKSIVFSANYKIIQGGYHFSHFYDEQKIFEKLNLISDNKVEFDQVLDFKNNLKYWIDDESTFEDYEDELPKNIQIIENQFFAEKSPKRNLVILNFHQNFVDESNLQFYNKVFNINFTKLYHHSSETDISEKLKNINIFISENNFYQSEIFELEFGINELKQILKKQHPLNIDEFSFCVFDDDFHVDNLITFTWKELKKGFLFENLKSFLIKNPS